MRDLEWFRNYEASYESMTGLEHVLGISEEGLGLLAGGENVGSSRGGRAGRGSLAWPERMSADRHVCEETELTVHEFPELLAQTAVTPPVTERERRKPYKRRK